MEGCGTRAAGVGENNERRRQIADEAREALCRDHAVRIRIVPAPDLLVLDDVVRGDEVRVDVAERGEVLEDDLL